MKNIKYILAIAILAIFAVACTEDENQITQQTNLATKSEISNQMTVAFYDTIKPYLAEGLISFNSEVSEVFNNSSSYEDFKIQLCGENQIDTTGENLLKVSYEYLKAGYSDDYVYSNYKGKEMLQVLSYLLENPSSDGSELFGFTTELTKEAAAPCKWYQLGCHLEHACDAAEKWLKEHKETVATSIAIIGILIKLLG